MRGLIRMSLTASLLSLALAGPATAQTAPALSQTAIRELIDAAKATAKATQESIVYARVTPTSCIRSWQNSTSLKASSTRSRMPSRHSRRNGGGNQASVRAPTIMPHSIMLT